MNNKNNPTNQPADMKSQRHTPGQAQDDTQKPGAAKTAQGQSQRTQTDGRPGSDNAAKSGSAIDPTNQRFTEDYKPGRSADGARPDNRGQAAGTASGDASNIEAPDNDEQGETVDENVDETDSKSSSTGKSKQSGSGASQANTPSTSSGRTDSGRDLKKPSTQTPGGRKH